MEKIIKNAKVFSELEINLLCDKIRNIAYAIHLFHGQGYLEKVYENALINRLQKSGIDLMSQYPITVFDEDGTIIGEYIADLFVQNTLIIELKAVKTIHVEHEAQILGYLKSSRIEHGLQINFGSFKFEIRKFILSKRQLSFET